MQKLFYNVPNKKTKRSIFVCQPKVNILDHLIPTKNYQDVNIQNEINKNRKVILYKKNLCRKKEITVPTNMNKKLKDKINQINNFHDLGFQNIKQKIKETGNVKYQNKSYQQTIKFKQNLQENENFGDKIDKLKENNLRIFLFKHQWFRHNCS